MTNTYKVGDLVKFRDDLEDGEMYGGLHYDSTRMDRFKSGIFKIKRCHSGNHYFLEKCSLNGVCFYISAAMLEPVQAADLDPAWLFDRRNFKR